MFINCPNCSALVATDLATDLPPERCPRCGFGPLIEQVELTVAKAESESVPQAKPDAAPPAGAEAAAEPAAVPTPEPPPEPEPSAPLVPEAATTTAPERHAPRFLRRSPGADARPGRRQVAAAAGLALLLAVQLLLADRARLSAEAGWRPVLVALCGALRCELPAWREPAAIAVEQRDVRPLPGRDGVLRVSATIRNDARWAQAWPRLVLTLSDVDGQALGMRAFAPAEYLAAPPQDVTVAGGESAAISMDIVEPSPHAVAFNFSFD